MAVVATVEAHPDKQVVLYCEAGYDAANLRALVLQQFNIRIPASVRVVSLHSTHLLAASRWPQFTLLGQSIGSLAVAWEALRQLVPEVWIDTTGWAFPYPLVWFAGSKVVSYVHYPTISTDMLLRVWGRRPTYNNDVRIASSVLMTAGKLVYYHLFACLYGFCGCFPAAVMVNSSWTRAHVRRLWWGASVREPIVLHPPCDASALMQLPLRRPLKTLHLCSIAQFRPEKNHRLQLHALQRAKELMHERGIGGASSRFKLSCVGGCRHAEDHARRVSLEELARELGVDDSVEFVPNASHEAMTRILASSVGGLHSMVDEHFGISVVEYMAAGCVPIAHDSGGPRQDIVVPALRASDHAPVSDAVGFLACAVEEYARCIVQLLTMAEDDRMHLARVARERASKFSNADFQEGWLRCISPAL